MKKQIYLMFIRILFVGIISLLFWPFMFYTGAFGWTIFGLLVVCSFLAVNDDLWDDRKNWFANDGIDYRPRRLGAAFR